MVEFYGQSFLFYGLMTMNNHCYFLLTDDLPIFCKFIALLLGANIIQFTTAMNVMLTTYSCSVFSVRFQLRFNTITLSETW